MAANPEVAVPRPAAVWRQKLAAFWRWWAGELAQVVPARFAALRGKTRIPVVALDDGDLVLVEPRSAAGPDSRVALSTLDAARAQGAAAALLQRAGGERGRVQLSLGHGEYLLRRVTMPAATEENLRQVLGFEMDRLTPFRAEDVYFDYRVLSRDSAAGTLLALIAVARRELVEARVAALRALGVSVQGVTLREESGGPAASLDLLPQEQRGERESSRERLIKTGLAVAALLLLGVALLFPAWRKRETVKLLLPVVAKAQSEAQATDAVAKDVERQLADYNFMVSKKHTAPAPLAYLEDLTRLMPDNTWLQQMEFKNTGKVREVQITGETASSSKLIEILEQSKLLQNAATRGSITKGSTPNSERFMIAAETRPRVLPESRPLIDPAAPSPAPVAPAAPAKAPGK